MRRAAQSLVVTVLVVVAGIWLLEQGPPLEGGDRLWDSRSPLLSDASVVVKVGARHTVLRSAAGEPVLLDRVDGSAHRLPRARVLGLAAGGETITSADGVLYGASPSGRGTWQKKASSLVPGDLVLAGSDGEIAAIGGCTAGRGVIVGLRIEDGAQAWRIDGPCPLAEAGNRRHFYASSPTAGGAVDVSVHDLADGKRVAEVPRVRDVQPAGDLLLVLDEEAQLSARDGESVNWLLDPETAALADEPATSIAPAYAGTPAIVFEDSTRALIDAASGTLRRTQGWGQGALERGAGGSTVARGREYLWKGKTLVAHNVFTGRELWRAELPAGTGVARLGGAEIVTVSLVRDNGRHQVFAFDAATGRQVVRTRASVKPWSLLPTGDGTLLATSGDRHYLLDIS